ncbi:MAG: glycosyltransferase [Planctomycetota bacterium]
MAPMGNEGVHEIGIITEVYGAYPEEFLRRHVQALSRYRPFLAVMERRNPDLFPYEPVHLLRSRSLVFRGMNTGLGLLPKRLQWTDVVEAEWMLERLIRRYRPRVFITYFAFAAGRVCGVLRKARVPYVMFLCGSPLNYAYRWPKSPKTRRIREAFQHAEKCYFVSEFLRYRGLALGCPADRAEVFSFGVPVSPEAAPVGREGEVRFLSVGGLVPVKGHDVLLRAFAGVLHAVPSCKLAIAGDGRCRRMLEELARQLGISERVVFLGYIGNEQVFRELGASHVYVHPSRRLETGQEEGQPIAVQEAMSAGVPVIATRTGGIPESVLDGETGYLADDGDVEGLVKRMIELARAPAKRARMGLAGRRRVTEKFNLEKQNARLAGIVEEIMRKKFA